jgi:predicted RNA binding protein YcfA (HicA-like mRNA interferase family)
MASSREILRVLERHGFIIRSQNGSHVKLQKQGKQVIVPHPRKDMPIGTYGSIIKQSGLTRQDFES